MDYLQLRVLPLLALLASLIYFFYFQDSPTVSSLTVMKMDWPYIVAEMKFFFTEMLVCSSLKEVIVASFLIIITGLLVSVL